MAINLEKLQKFSADFWKEFRKPTSATEVGAEVSKASLELAIALGLLGSGLAPAGVAVAGLSFVGLSVKAVKFYQKTRNEETTLEEYIILASRFAYLESFEKILKTIEDKAFLAKIETMRVNKAVTEQLNIPEQFNINEEEARKATTCFRETKLAKAFHELLSSCLQRAELTKSEAETLTQRVDWSTQRYMNQALAEAGDTVKSFAGLFRDGWRKELEKYQSIDDYLKHQIAPKPLETVFAETFTFKDIYVPLKAQLLDSNGQSDEKKQLLDLETWAIDLLQNPQKLDRVMFIQGGPGRGKSVFCRIFADWVRQNLHPIWTPILIRLRDIKTLEKQFVNTLKAALPVDFVTNDSGWLQDKNVRYLFLLDGFDELLMEGRTSGGLEDFLRQVGGFQQYCKDFK